tara:strand:+ start:507 stop:1070 length:564 start_codon:yes stop_codon:yes gene_type:complete
MATKKVTQLATATSADASDLVMIVDVSDTAMSPEGTNKQITTTNFLAGAGGLLTQVSQTVSNAQVLDMKYDDDPIILVAKQAGKIIVPVSVNVEVTYALITDVTTTDLRCGWNAGTSGTTYYWDSKRNFMNNVTTDFAYIFSGGIPSSNGITAATSLVNEDLNLWSTDDFLGGFSFVVYTTYYTITV